MTYEEFALYIFTKLTDEQRKRPATFKIGDKYYELTKTFNIEDETISFNEEKEEWEPEYDVHVVIQGSGQLPVCYTLCGFSQHCANHCSADCERLAEGLTPDLQYSKRENVWKCSKYPQKCKGAISVTGELFNFNG